MFLAFDGVTASALWHPDHSSTEDQSSTKAAAPAAQPKSTVAQVMTDYSDLETESAKTASVFAAVAALQSAQQKDGSYNDLALREATLLWLTQRAALSSQASSSSSDPLDAAVTQATQEKLNTLFSSSPSALTDAATALKDPAGSGASQASLDLISQSFGVLQKSPNDPTAHSGQDGQSIRA